MTDIKLPALPVHPELPDAIYLLNATELRARDIEVARAVLEAAAKSLDRLDKQARDYFARMGSSGMPEYDAVDCARYIRALEVSHD